MKILLTAILMVGCGADDLSSLKNNKEEQQKEAALVVKPDYYNLSGYVVSAFDISVDGEHYSDSEEFYTEQLVKLEDNAKESGYENYKVKFDAEVGLDDLKNNMKVYIVPVENQGHAAESIVDYKGVFSAVMPKEAEGEVFKIRANKRIGVTLIGPEGDRIKWCYNFYAQEQQYELNADSKPVVLNSFLSKITKYKCFENKSGISIPNDKVPAIPVAEAIKNSGVDYFQEYVEQYDEEQAAKKIKEEKGVE